MVNKQRWEMGRALQITDTLVNTPGMPGSERAEVLLRALAFEDIGRLGRRDMDDPYSTQLRLQTRRTMEAAVDQLEIGHPLRTVLERGLKTADSKGTGRGVRNALGDALETAKAMLDG